MTEFLPGIELSEAFYREIVRPGLADRPHSAGILGAGSDVLEYDNTRSMDHGWGARVLVFVDEGQNAAKLEGLPDEFRGHPVRGVRTLTVRDFFRERLAVDPAGPIGPADWLTFSEQGLLEMTRGKVFHDGLGTLEPTRARFAAYPEDVWRYLLAAQWRRISQEEHLVARAADVGDEIGSRIIAARLARDLMRLGFLQERTYAPYPKWFGTAFRELSIATMLGPPLEGVLDAGDWPAREAALVVAYEIAARRQNELGIGEPGPERASPFFDRPFRVIGGDTFSDSIYATIGDPRVRALPRHLGGIDQVSDSTDLLSYTALRARLRSLYEQATPASAGS